MSDVGLINDVKSSPKPTNSCWANLNPWTMENARILEERTSAVVQQLHGSQGHLAPELGPHVGRGPHQ